MNSVKPRRGRTAARCAIAVLLGLCAVAANAITCTVPGNRATVQAAIDDPNCTEIVLGAQVFFEDLTIRRSLVLRGAGTDSTTLTSDVLLTGNGVNVEIRDLTIDSKSYDPAVEVDGGARLTTRRVAVRNMPAIFADGFETGNLSRWSLSTP